MFLASCGGDETANLPPDQQAFVKTSQAQFDKLKEEGNKILQNHRKTASMELTRVLNEMQADMGMAEKALTELKAGGSKAWNDNKPKVEKALQELGAKVAAATVGAKAETIN